MKKQDNVIPIGRGKPSRLELRVSPGPSSVGFRLERKPEPAPPAKARPRRSQRPGKLVEFPSAVRKESGT